MAEGLAKRRCGTKVLSIESVGIAALSGHKADPLAEQVMATNGIDISSHFARQASENTLKNSDLILALDESHESWINIKFPMFRGRVFKLGKWDKNKDVPDPYRRPITVFEDVYRQLECYIDAWFSRINV